MGEVLQGQPVLAPFGSAAIVLLNFPSVDSVGFVALVVLGGHVRRNALRLLRPTE